MTLTCHCPFGILPHAWLAGGLLLKFVHLLYSGLSPVPLKSISVTLSIREFVAGVSATLNYENEEEVPLETFFVFPMDEDSAVYSFEAEIDGKKIKAELKDKRKVLGMSRLSPPSLYFLNICAGSLHTFIKNADVECFLQFPLAGIFLKSSGVGSRGINQRHSKFSCEPGRPDRRPSPLISVFCTTHLFIQPSHL